MDLKKSRGIDGARVERVLEIAGMATNKNTVPGDKSALFPGGIRMGTPAVTTRGFTENDLEQVAEFFHRGVDIAIAVKAEVGPKLKDFKAALAGGAGDNAELVALQEEVRAFAQTFPTIGYGLDEMTYK